MLFGSRDFKIMEQSAQALWQKQNIISQNIANHDTPNYKAKKLTFSEVLKDKQNAQNSQNTNDDKLINVSVKTDETTSIRPDGNNVNLVKENLDLYKTYMQSNYLYEKIGDHFTNIRYVLSQMPK